MNKDVTIYCQMGAMVGEPYSIIQSRERREGKGGVGDEWKTLYIDGRVNILVDPRLKVKGLCQSKGKDNIIKRMLGSKRLQRVWGGVK